MTALRTGTPPDWDDSSSELLSKVSVPKGGVFLVPRRWLFDELTQGAGRPLTVVSGPPGWGKTTLVASWVAHDLAPGHLAWLTLDPQDNDTATFWTSFVQALVLHGVSLPRRLHWPGESVPGQSFLQDLSAALGRSDETVVVVLDGFDAITDDVVQRDLDGLLRSTAPDLRLVLTVREEPRALVDRYRRSGDLTMIRTAGTVGDHEDVT